MSELDGYKLIHHLVNIVAGEVASKTSATASDDLQEQSSYLLVEKMVTEIGELVRASKNPNNSLNVLSTSRDIALHLVAAIDDFQSTSSTSENLGITGESSEIQIQLYGLSGSRSFRSFESLPPELIVKIFKLGIDNTTDALKFSGINKRFRDIALREPSLWTRIDSACSLEAIRTSVQRASDRCFSLTMHDGPTLPDFLNYFKEFHSRISSVSLVKSSMSTRFLEQFSELTLDQLTSWEMDRDFGSAITFFLLGKLHLPNLRHYTGILFCQNPGDPPPPWAEQLTSCSVSPLPRCYEINLPNCRSLELYFHEKLVNPDDIPSEYNLPNLQHLIIDTYSGALVTAKILRDCISTDQLRTLQIRLPVALPKPQESDLRDTLRSLSFRNLISYKFKFYKRNKDIIDHTSIFLEITNAPVLGDLEITGVGEHAFGECIRMARGSPCLKTVTFRDCDDRETNGIFGLAKSLIDPSTYTDFKRFRVIGCRMTTMQLFRLRQLQSRRIYLE